MVYSAEYIKKKLEQEMILSQAFGRDLVCLNKAEEFVCVVFFCFVVLFLASRLKELKHRRISR